MLSNLFLTQMAVRENWTISNRLEHAPQQSVSRQSSHSSQISSDFTSSTIIQSFSLVFLCLFLNSAVARSSRLLVCSALADISCIRNKWRIVYYIICNKEEVCCANGETSYTRSSRVGDKHLCCGQREHNPDSAEPLSPEGNLLWIFICW
jgi:hypothetical protein